MVKVINPLGSDEAHGQMMKAVIFQGRTAKQYHAPARVRSATALAQEEFFTAYNKMLATAGIWARSAWRTVLGPDWFGLLYQWISQREVYGAFWDLLGEPEKVEWDEAAPFRVTGTLRAGRVFFVCVTGAAMLFEYHQCGDFGLPHIEHENLPAIVEWWNRDLTGVFLSGKYDDYHPNVEYSLYNWARALGGNFFGGGYSLSATTTDCWFQFYFLGRWLSLWYKKNELYAGLSVSFDNAAPVIVSQNGENSIVMEKWTSAQLPYGLHHVIVRRDGQEGGIGWDCFQVE